MLIVSLEKASARARELALEELDGGNPIIAPSDTCYGFIADATRAEGVEQVIAIKKRRPEKSFLIMVSSIEMAESIAEVSDLAKEMMRKYLPGSLTIVLPRKKSKQLYGVYRDSIGIRIPNHNLCLDLIKELNRPLITTSANLTGENPAYCIDTLMEQIPMLKDAPLIMLDGGELVQNPPSTIIRIDQNGISLLRQGPVLIPGLELSQ